MSISKCIKALLLSLILVLVLLIHRVHYRRFRRFLIIVLPLVFNPFKSYSSYLLLLSLLRYMSSVKLKNARILDVGCGSGFLSVIVAGIGVYVVALDIDERSITNTLINAKVNDVYSNMDIVISNGCMPFREKSFDFVITNPPYLPCPYVSYFKALCCGINSLILYQLLYSCLSKARKGVLVVLSSLTDFSTLFVKSMYLKSRVRCVNSPLDEICCYEF